MAASEYLPSKVAYILLVIWERPLSNALVKDSHGKIEHKCNNIEDLQEPDVIKIANQQARLDEIDTLTFMEGISLLDLVFKSFVFSRIRPLH